MPKPRANSRPNPTQYGAVIFIDSYSVPHQNPLKTSLKNTSIQTPDTRAYPLASRGLNPGLTQHKPYSG